MLSIEKVSHHFMAGGIETPVLRDITFHVRPHEMVALLGSSGSGKSTLLNLMAGLMKPSQGDIRVDGHSIVAMSENELALFRREHIGFIFQSYELIPQLTVYENIELPLVFQGVPSRTRREKSSRLLDRVGLDGKGEMFPSQLSGGQQQRVSIARSLITEPAIVFADEPTGNLDTHTEKEIIDLLVEMNEQLKTTFIIVTHELEVARRTKRIIQLRDGRLIEAEAEAEAGVGP